MSFQVAVTLENAEEISRAMYSVSFSSVFGFREHYGKQVMRKERGYMESNEGFIRYDTQRYVLAGRRGEDDHVLVAGDVLELSISGLWQAVYVASGGYCGWFYVTANGKRARFALCMRARLASY